MIRLVDRDDLTRARLFVCLCVCRCVHVWAGSALLVFLVFEIDRTRCKGGRWSWLQGTLSKFWGSCRGTMALCR